MDKMKCIIRAAAALAAVAVAMCAASAEAPADIGALERQLNALGYHSDVFDGTLDDETRGALRALQMANGLAVTGEYDEDTRALLDSGEAVGCSEYLLALSQRYSQMPITQLGSIDETVGMVQRALRALGYFDGVSDNAFGEETQAAVIRFQLANGLRQTGVVDRSTLIRMLEGAPVSWQNFLATCACAPGDSGAYVRLVQQKLAKLGYFYGGITGTYGEMTSQAVVDFQGAAGLEPTGRADAQTCDALFTREIEDALAGTGDSAEAGAVGDLQRVLARYGYYTRAVSGRFDVATETALKLFQIANGYPATGAADSATLALLEDDGTLPLETARARLLDQSRAATDTAWEAMTATALAMRGQAFEAGDAVQYPGFTFVQYACLSAGIPVSTPQDLYALIDTEVEDVSECLPGDVIAIDPGEEAPILLGICAGNSHVIYATGESDWVLETDIRLLEPAGVERWRAGQ